jgi:homoserine kinase
MQAVFEYAQHPELKAKLTCVNNIAMGSGLGSSSSALVGGGALARMLLQDVELSYHLSDEELFVLMARLEGHPDNVAPALFGGFTICWQDAALSDATGATGVTGEAGVATPTSTPADFRCERFQLSTPMAAIIVRSNISIATSYARSLIPEAVPHKDACFNVAHAGLLAAALVSGRGELLRPAIDDKLHQPYRIKAISDYEAVSDILRAAGADAVAISGAGPTIIAFATGLTAGSAYRKAEDIAKATTGAITALENRQTPQALNFAVRGALPL